MSLSSICTKAGCEYARVCVYIRKFPERHELDFLLRTRLGHIRAKRINLDRGVQIERETPPLFVFKLRIPIFFLFVLFFFFILFLSVFLHFHVCSRPKLSRSVCPSSFCAPTSIKRTGICRIYHTRPVVSRGRKRF